MKSQNKITYLKLKQIENQYILTFKNNEIWLKIENTHRETEKDKYISFQN